MKILLFLFVPLIMPLCSGNTQDIVYPKEDVPFHLSGNNHMITERIPVYIPMRCPENMLLYPGTGQKSSWLCDCKPGYVYFPLNNTCHEPHRQGPCPSGQYVYLAVNESVPQCVENPCVKDRMVPYKGRCYELGTFPAACNGGELYVDSTTYQVICRPRPVYSVIRTPELNCPEGSRRDSSGVCRVVLR